MASLGRHLLVELWECDSRIDDVEVIGRAIDAAVVPKGPFELDFGEHAIHLRGPKPKQVANSTGE